MSKYLTALAPQLLRCVNPCTFVPQFTLQRFLHVTAIDAAARKGTREKARKKKIVKVVEKIKFIPGVNDRKTRMKAEMAKKIDKHKVDTNKPEAVDNVFIMTEYRTKMLSVSQAVDFFKKSNHPSRYDSPDADLKVSIHINMMGEKKTKFKESFSRLALIPHPLVIDTKRTILVFCKDENLQKELLANGATHTGGLELIKQIQTGDLKLQDYEYFLAHPGIITEMMPIKGVMKRRFPTVLANTVDQDIVGLLVKYLSGVMYTAKRDMFQLNFGSVDMRIGTLATDVEKIEANLAALLKDINQSRPKRGGLFITRCLLTSEPSPTTVEIDPFVYIERERKAVEKSKIVSVEVTEDDQEDDSDSDDEKEKKESSVAAVV